MASNVRQNRTLETYCCLRGLPEASFASKNEVTSAFCLAPSYFLRQLKPATDPVNKLGPPRLSLLLNCLPVLRIQEFFRLIHHIS